MTLAPGARVGPYEILSALGAGGMGEVYKARDTRLDRTVAIKVLPESLASDPQSRERFEREARAVAALNHPHICTLYDVGRQEDTDFLVMEYLEGETLAQRISSGPPMSVQNALRYAIQIADALDKAHRAGIVHRDLKPGNVMLTKSGAKLLDFGLAKATVPTAAGAGLSMLPTTPPNLTMEGAVLGTLQYMAPEQIEGEEADGRTDIFAFGVVLYEMLTGKRAFTGKTQASLFGAILKEEPAAISAIQPLAPAPLDRIVRKCLAKDPDARWQSAADLRDELNWVADTASPTAPSLPPMTVSAARGGRATLVLTVAAIISTVVAAMLGVLYFQTGSATEAPPIRFSVTPPRNIQFVTGFGQTIPVVSPEGRRVAFVARTTTGAPLLWVRSLDALDAVSLPGTEDAFTPAWCLTAAVSRSAPGSCSRPLLPRAAQCGRSATLRQPLLESPGAQTA